MFNVHLMSLMLSHHLHVHRQPSFFFAWGWSTILYKLCLSISIRWMGGVIVSAIVDLQGYTNTLQTRLTGMSTGLHLPSPKTRSAGNGVANKEESFN